MACQTISSCRSAAFSASSRLVDLNGGIAMPWMTRACIGSRSLSSTTTPGDPGQSVTFPSNAGTPATTDTNANRIPSDTGPTPAPSPGQSTSVPSSSGARGATGTTGMRGTQPSGSAAGSTATGAVVPACERRASSTTRPSAAGQARSPVAPGRANLMRACCGNPPSPAGIEIGHRGSC
jgi:hypothetical protein